MKGILASTLLAIPLLFSSFATPALAGKIIVRQRVYRPRVVVVRRVVVRQRRIGGYWVNTRYGRRWVPVRYVRY
jgi:hypothetical protein